MTKQKLVDTELAATYWAMLSKPDRPISLITHAELKRARRQIYELCKNGHITNHGARARGQARWDLAELHRIAQDRNIG